MFETTAPSGKRNGLQGLWASYKIARIPLCLVMVIHCISMFYSLAILVQIYFTKAEVFRIHILKYTEHIIQI